MRKYLSYAFFGPLSKHFAGTRPLTDSERRNLLIMIYGLTAWVCYYQWRDILVDKAIESAFPIVDTDGTRYAAFSDEEPDFWWQNEDLSPASEPGGSFSGMGDPIVESDEEPDFPDAAEYEHPDADWIRNNS